MARVYREAPLNSVWEGTANMMCMDVRRAMARDARTLDALFDELRPLAGQDARFDALVRHVGRLARDAARDEFLARPMTEVVARALQAPSCCATARTRSWTRSWIHAVPTRRAPGDRTTARWQDRPGRRATHLAAGRRGGLMAGGMPAAVSAGEPGGRRWR